MMSLANGFDKVFIYRETGSTPSQHAGAGIIRNDGSLRASYFTMANLTRQLDGVKPERVLRLRTEDDRAWLYYWERPDGHVLTAWTFEGSTVSLGLNLGKCLVTDAFGAETEMEVTEDFELTEFPVYISRIGDTDSVDALLKKAREKETTRKGRKILASKAEVILLDFGGPDSDIGTKKIGTVRQFIPVGMEDMFDEAKGYGFVSDDVSGKNISAHWIKSKTEKDAIQLYKPAVFRISPKPGSYQLWFKGEKFAEDSELLVNGGQGGVVRIPLKAGENAPPTDSQPSSFQQTIPWS